MRKRQAESQGLPGFQHGGGGRELRVGGLDLLVILLAVSRTRLLQLKHELKTQQKQKEKTKQIKRKEEITGEFNLEKLDRSDIFEDHLFIL